MVVGPLSRHDRLSHEAWYSTEMRTFFPATLTICAALVLSSCVVVNNNSPVIDSLDYPSSVGPNADGSYTISITVNFHDSDEDVVAVDFDSNIGGIHDTYPITATMSGQTTITVDLPDGTPTGTFDFWIDVVSASGLTSANYNDSIDLVP
jgi:hypothetical protein